jgi:predicted RNase H-like nuclease
VTTVVGVDGWRSGWVAVVLRDGRFATARAAPTLLEIVEGAPEAAAVAVDIPIGLPVQGKRRADEEARAFIGIRRSSVFWAPPRVALLAETHVAAVAACRAREAPGISQQAYALRRKILEVEPIAASDPRVAEIHPEVSFRELAGGTLAGKKTWNGQHHRRAALARAGIELPDELPGPAASAPVDDVLDAAVAAWSASRIAASRAKTFPCDAAAGEPRIWY